MYRRPICIISLFLGLTLLLQAASSQPPPARLSPKNDLSVMARDPFQIFDNLYFVGIGEVGSYVIETSDGLILLDTLWDLDGYTEYLLGNIREVGRRPQSFRRQSRITRQSVNSTGVGGLPVRDRFLRSSERGAD